MKWFPKPGPREGDTRHVTRFALWPATMTDGTVVWLERYRAVEEYRYVHDWDAGGWWTWETKVATAIEAP